MNFFAEMRLKIERVIRYLPGEVGAESLVLQFHSHDVSESAHVGLGERDL